MILNSVVLFIYLVYATFVAWFKGAQTLTWQEIINISLFIMSLAGKIIPFIGSIFFKNSNYMGLAIIIDVSADFVLQLSLYCFVFEMLEIYGKLDSETY